MRASAIIVTLLPFTAAVPTSPSQSACPVPASEAAPSAGTSDLVEVKVFKDDEYKGAWRNLVLMPGVCRDLTTEFPELTSVKPAAGVQCTLFKHKCSSSKRLEIPETGTPNIGKKFNDKVRGISCQPVVRG